MSFDLVAKVMKTKVGNPYKKLVFIKLADNASDLGECWPSYQHIADQCEMSKRSVMRYIAELEESGFLRKEARKGPKGNSSNVYYLNVEKLNQPSERQSPPSDRESLPSDTQTPPPSDTQSPRIYNSFESIKEPDDDAHVTSPDDPLFNQSPHTEPRFALPIDWLPERELLNTRCNAVGCPLSSKPREQILDIIGEFVNYWSAQGSIHSNQQWHAKLATWLKRKLAERAANPARPSAALREFPKD